MRLGGHGLGTTSALPSAKGFRFGVVVSRFNPSITELLEAEALACLNELGASQNKIEVVRVPGAGEIPVAVGGLLAMQKPSAVIALGCLIRGRTLHFELVARSVAEALQGLAVSNGVPIANGILTARSRRQARRRATGVSMNRGRESVLVAVEMANLFERWRS